MGRWRRGKKRGQYNRSRDRLDLGSSSSLGDGSSGNDDSLHSSSAASNPVFASNHSGDDAPDTPPTRNTSFRSSSSLGAGAGFESSSAAPGEADASSGHELAAGGSRRRHHRRGKPSRNLGFGLSEQERIRRYLEAYRDGAERACFFPVDGADADATFVPEWCLVDGGIWIAGHHFASLSEEVLLQPFLSLPTSLGSKQRKFVHALCVDVGLFHCGVGDRNVSDSRRVAISIHLDGLEYVHNLSRPTGAPILECRPWFYRNDHPSDTDHGSNTTAMRYVDLATLKGKGAIQSLVDQPGRCLRDAHDSIDFAELEGRDLSEVSTPMGEGSSWRLIDSGEKMRACAKEIKESQPSEIAFDLEMYNQSMYNQSTCLIQLSSDAGTDYIIDVFSPGVWDTVPLLAPLFADPNIVKIGHAIGGMDVPALHRDFGLFVVNAFDTHEAARVLRLKHTSLASICEHYGLRSSAEYATLKKKYQASDWRRRPLSEEMIKYGLYDAHYLLELRRLLIRDLTRLEFWDDAGIDRVAEAQIVSRALAATMRMASVYEDGEGGVKVDDSLERATQSSDASDDDGYYTPTDDISFEIEGCDGANSSEGGGDSLSFAEGSGRGRKRKSLFRAKELRMNAQLMKVLTISQDRCKQLWKGKEEPHLKNALLVSIMQRAATGDESWDSSHLSLYQQLVDWRKKVASRWGVMPAHVCPLDLLVLVSHKRPNCESNLRRLSYFLPALLECECDSGENYIDEILSLVHSSFEDGGKHQHLIVRSYANRVKRANAKAASVGTNIPGRLNALNENEAHVQNRSNSDAHSKDHSSTSKASKREIEVKEKTWKKTPRLSTVFVAFAAFGALVLIDVIRKKKK